MLKNCRSNQTHALQLINSKQSSSTFTPREQEIVWREKDGIFDRMLVCLIPQPTRTSTRQKAIDKKDLKTRDVKLSEEEKAWSEGYDSGSSYEIAVETGSNVVCDEDGNAVEIAVEMLTYEREQFLDGVLSGNVNIDTRVRSKKDKGKGKVKIDYKSQSTEKSTRVPPSIATRKLEEYRAADKRRAEGKADGDIGDWEGVDDNVDVYRW